jgi:hypothetical protein
VSGLIRPGDYVDVVLTQVFEKGESQLDGRQAGANQSATRHALSETILRNVRVIAIDQEIVQGGRGLLAAAIAPGDRERRGETHMKAPYNILTVAAGAALALAATAAQAVLQSIKDAGSKGAQHQAVIDQVLIDDETASPVTGRPVAEPGLALALQSDPRPVLDAGGNLHRVALDAPLAAAAVTLRTRLLDDRAVAATAWTRARQSEEALRLGEDAASVALDTPRAFSIALLAAFRLLVI